MAKTQELLYVCGNCGEEFARWQGQCSSCQEWNSLKEFRITKNELRNKKSGKHVAAESVKFSEIKVDHYQPVKSGIGEFDRVLGSGIVPGTVILLGGDPGIGKSTLLLQLTEKLPNVLYVSGEESKEQVGLRAKRLGLNLSKASFIAETNVEAILTHLAARESAGNTPLSSTPGVKTQIHTPGVFPSGAEETGGVGLLVIDSIQTMYHPDFPSTPGSIVQVRETAQRFVQFAKHSGIPVVLIGHVTKEGTVAGPRTLEHLVDVVLYLEGDPQHEHRILRGVKNRFGAATEIGVFAMTEQGLESVDNPSELFLRERATNVPGSVVTATLEGRRPILVEIQALSTKTQFGYPRRTASGFDINRLHLLLAVLQERAHLPSAEHDIYLNVVGGYKLREPAADLAVVLACASALQNKPLPANLCAWGEVGLSGEFRSVPYQELRVKEAKALGYLPVVKSRTMGELLKLVFRQ